MASFEELNDAIHSAKLHRGSYTVAPVVNKNDDSATYRVTSHRARLLIPADTEGRDRVSVGDIETVFTQLRQPTETIHVQLKLVTVSNFDSYIELEFIVYHTAVDQTPKKSIMSFKLNHTNMKRASIVNGYDISNKASEGREFAQDLFNLSAEEERFADNKKLHLITIPYNGNNIYAQSMYTDATYGSQQPVVDLIRKAFESEAGFDIEILLRGIFVTEAIEKINDEIDEIRKSDPLKKFHPARGPNTPVFMQMGSTLPVDKLPIVQVPTHLTFGSKGVYVTVNGIAIFLEFEHIKSLTSEFKAKLRVMNIPGAGNRVYQCLLDYGDTKTQMREDDSISIDFEPEDASNEDDWRAIVTEPCPYASANDTTILLFRPYDKSSGTFSEAALPIDIDVTRMRSAAQARQNIRNATGIDVLVRLHVSDKAIKAQMDALNLLQRTSGTKMQWNLLLAKKMTDLPICDMFSDIGVTAEERNRIIEQFAPDSLFSLEQIEAKKMVRHARGNMALIDGYSGTGKSDFIAKIVQPVAQTPNCQGGPNQILVVAGSNANVDDLTVALDKVANAYIPEGGKKHVVVRAHATTSERHVIMKDAELVHPRDFKPPMISDEDGTLMDSLNELSVARNTLKNYKKATYRPYGIQDKRVKQLEFSTGAWMARVTGLMGEDHELFVKGKFDTFRSEYDRYTSGDVFTPEQNREFTKLIWEVHAYVLSIATFVVTTPVQAAQAKVHNKFKPVLIVVDEAARLIEADLWILFAFYGERFMLMVGDPRQTLPVVFSNSLVNGFHSQLRLSVFHRLKLAGASSVEFRTQQRFATSIRELVSSVSYQGNVKDGPNVNNNNWAVSGRALLHELFYDSAANKIQDTNVVFVKVSGSVTMRLAQPTKFNKLQMSATLSILEKLLTVNKVAPWQIGIIVPYIGSLNILKRGKNMLQEKYPHLDLDQLLISTIDGSQGRQRSVIIMAFGITTALGFLKEESRITTGISRAEHVLILLGDIKQMADIQGFHHTKLGKVVTFMQRRNFIYTWPKTEISEEHKQIMGQ